MVQQTIQVVWSKQAINDLKVIFDWIKETTSLALASKITNEIVQKSKEVTFVEQYQVDEFLGTPFRRIIIRHYKMIYKVQSKTEIRILKIFDTRQHHNKLKL